MGLQVEVATTIEPVSGWENAPGFKAEYVKLRAEIGSFEDDGAPVVAAALRVRTKLAVPSAVRRTCRLNTSGRPWVERHLAFNISTS